MAAIPVMLAGCSTGSIYTTRTLEPIPGSITYNGQPKTRLVKAPVGSTVPHQFHDEYGRRVDEIYVIQSDRSLKLVNRRICRLPFCDD
ncbi:hypothetical protein GOZ89_24155 [Agrobacterium vitis]|nr:hypothetical protein [Agrobacterium vitis]MVA82505.1 hypothetical protein [Agrobacterium vitis]